MTEKEAKALRAQLEQLGWSQRKAAEKLDVTERTIQRYCSGKASMPFAVAFTLRSYLNILENDQIIEAIDKGERQFYMQANGKKLDVSEAKKESYQEINAKLKDQLKKSRRK